MSSFSKLSLEELKCLIDHPDSEPTATQLIKLSVAYKVSVPWLLGYHTSRDCLNEPIHSALITAIVRRDAIDATARRLKKKGFMASYSEPHRPNSQVSYGWCFPAFRARTHFYAYSRNSVLFLARRRQNRMEANQRR